MVSLIQHLVSALREELEHYGEMLARLDDQQELVMSRATDALLQSVEAVQIQGLAIQRARQEREQHQAALAAGCEMPTDADLTSLLRRMPDDYAMLVSALMQENNQLLVRIQQRARQNHMLLAQSLELMGGLLKTLFPGADQRVYSDPAHAPWRPAAPAFSLYEAVG